MRNLKRQLSALRAPIGLIMICAGLLAYLAAPAFAAEEDPTKPPKFDPVLSLTGDCTTSPTDEVPDPSCPYSPSHQPQPLKDPGGVATDRFGDIYVASESSTESQGRIDIFNASGEFVLEIADPHRPKQVAVSNDGALYAIQSNPLGNPRVYKYVPTAFPPTATTSYGEPTVFESSPWDVGAIAINPADDHLYVESGEIENYAPDGTLEWTIPFRPGFAERVGAHSIAVWGKTGDIYLLANTGTEPFAGEVFILDGTTHEPKLRIEGPESENGFYSPVGLAVDQSNGDVFVGDVLNHGKVDRYRGFGEGPGEPGDLLAQFSHSFETTANGGSSPQLAVDSPVTPGESGYESPNEGNVYVPSGSTKAHLYAFEPAPSTASPSVSGLAASEITDTEATLEGEVDPHGLATTYHFEYVDAAGFAASGWAGARSGPVPEGQIGATSEAEDVSVPIAGLEPGIRYRYRLVAENAEGVFADEGLTFATYPAATGLPDSRRYELVTPSDSAGHLPAGMPIGGRGAFDTSLATDDGTGLMFASLAGDLPSLSGNGIADVYQAVRTDDGWTTDAAGPTGAQSVWPIAAGASAGDRYSFWTVLGSNELFGSPAGSLSRIHGPTAYLRLPDGGFELVGRGSLGEGPEVSSNYISPDGAHVIFSSQPADNSGQDVRLEPDAPPLGTYALYDRTPGGETHVVSLLPGDVTPAAGENAVYRGASTDGSAVVFSIDSGPDSALYEHNHGVTVPVADGPTEYAGISASGDSVFYLKAGNLFVCDTTSVGCEEAGVNEAVEIGSGGQTRPVNIAPDGARAYFVSSVALTGAEENAGGEAAAAGAMNLYVWTSGDVRFAAGLAAQDVTGEVNLTNWVLSLTAGGGIDPSRSNADGSIMVFESGAGLTPGATGEQTEVYRYDYAQNRIDCISCGPVGAAQGSGASLEDLFGSLGTSIESGPAGSVTPEFSMLSPYAPVHNMTDDGNEVFFQSDARLVLTDQNDTQDIYEWSRPGTRGCVEDGPAFQDSAGGCIYLISSGRSPSASYLYAATPSGGDVFFRTAASLVPRDVDGGVPSIYDARVGGGFAEAAGPPASCQGESCREESVSPSVSVAPASERLTGSPSKPKAHKPKKHHKKKHRRHHKKKRQGHHEKKRHSAHPSNHRRSS